MDSKTILLGVIGDPISHSKSPLMMNRAFALCKLNMAYGAFHVKAEQLPAAIAGVRALGMRGLNVTIPHKEAVMPLLDELDESARLIGAVNTIVNEQGVLKGYNTDGIGYARSLEEEIGFRISGAEVLVIGAGGAARAVVYALLKRGAAKIYICNRTPERTAQLVADFSELGNIQPVTEAQLPDLKDRIQLLINTTSVGMTPNHDRCPLADTSWLHEGLTVSDLVYNPRITRLLEIAAEHGAATHGGLGMLVYQGAYAFEYWTGHKAPTEAMWQEVTR